FVERLLQMPLVCVQDTEVVERLRLAVRVASRGLYAKRLLILIERKRVLSQLEIDIADVHEGCALLDAVADLAPDRQCRLVLFDSMRVLAEGLVRIAHVVDGPRLACPILQLAANGQRQTKLLQRLCGLAYAQ